MTKIHLNISCRWVQTACFKVSFPIKAVSWSSEGNRLLLGGRLLQLWHEKIETQPEQTSTLPLNMLQPHQHFFNLIQIAEVRFEIGDTEKEASSPEIDANPRWKCAWENLPARDVTFVEFSPDGTLFATCCANDCLVKIWYHQKSGKLNTVHIN